MEKINTVVVGYGGMGKYHADNIEKFENFNLVGIYDIKEERCELARENNVKVYDSFEDVLADSSVELIVCATYNDVHKDIAIRAMRAGKNVISEKAVDGCQLYKSLCTIRDRYNVDFIFCTKNKIIYNNG